MKNIFTIYNYYITSLLLAIATLLVTYLGWIMSNEVGLIIEILSLVFYCSTVSFLSRNNKLNPSFWLPPVFMLYSISAPFLYILGVYQYYDSYAEVLFVEHIAIIMFLISYFNLTGKDKISVNCLTLSISNKTISDKLVLFVFMSFAIIYIALLIRSGISIKFDKAITQDVFLAFDFLFTMLIVIYSFVICKSWLLRSAAPIKHIISFFIIILLASLLTLERDIIFRAIVVLIFLYFVNVGKANLFKLGIALITLIVFSTIYKIYLSGSSLSDISMFSKYSDSFSIYTILAILVFGSEFRTASENLALIIDKINIGALDYLNGHALLTEFYTILSFGFLNDREYSGGMSAWFSKEFFINHYEAGGGSGFSLVGQGYLDQGIFGVAVLFMLFGLLVRFFYIRAGRSIYWLIFYINIIPIVMFSLRQGVGAPISQGLKHVFIPILIIYIASKLVKKA
jgi:oligosaccharide repeat unit polymerase